jgi:hypothetical protein
LSFDATKGEGSRLVVLYSWFKILWMTEPEEMLTGGNVADEVVRVGMTVRKPATKSTPAVHSFLKHLSLTGYTGCPQAFGVDDKGRQVLEFIPGEVVHKAGRNIQTDLYRVGRLIRAFHDAAASFRPVADASWDVLTRSNGQETICHNDLAPWNLIIGPERWVFIDWDNAAPGTRLWDLAWSAISFPPIVPGCNLSDAAQAVRALCKGYGLEPSDYGLLVTLMAQRARAASDLLIEGARMEEQPWARLFAESGDHYWGPVSDYIESSGTDLVGLLLQER